MRLPRGIRQESCNYNNTGRNAMKSILKRIPFAACALMLGTAAQAQSAAPSPITGNLTLTTQYISRGFQQTWGKPALQGGFDYAHPSGWAAGTWMSNVSSKFIEGATVEWDLYTSYGGTAGDIGYSGALYYYMYPGAKITASDTRYDYGELSLGLAYKMLSAKYNYTYTKDFFGFTDARGTGYLDLGANFDLGSGMALQLHYGSGHIRNWSAYNWQDYKVGLSKSFSGGWSVGAAYTKGVGATNAYDNYPATTPNSAGVVETSNPLQGNFILSVTRTF